jgi:LysM repeat protein
MTTSANPSSTGKPGPSTRPAGPREIDLTWWLLIAGLTVFVVLLAGAFTIYTLSEVASLEATATAAMGLAATSIIPPTDTAPPPTPTTSPTTITRQETSVVLADTATRAPSPTRTLTPTASDTSRPVTATTRVTATPRPSATATLAPTATATLRPSVTASPTRAGTPTPFVYVVRDGDTLGAIAQVYGLTLDEVLAANPGLANPDNLIVGQTLIVPFASTPAAVRTPATAPDGGSGTPGAGVPRSILEGDLGAAYPLALAGPRVTIHYQPGSFTEVSDPQVVLDNAEEALVLVEQTLGVTFPGTVDVYLAGSLFASPNQALRQRPYPAQRRVFILYDGSGSAAERRYLLAHELTHVVAWHTYGIPGSVLLSEGLATYAGLPYLAEGGFVGYQDFCRALARTNRVPSLAVIENSVQGFLDPVRSLYNYNTGACFVGYLFEQGGAPAFSQVYSASDYQEVYGKSLQSLGESFTLQINSGAFQIGFDPERLVAYYDEVATGYDLLFASANPEQTAYETLDDARLAVVTGNFDGARALLDQFHILTR